MTRDEVLARLRPHEAELREAGITALYLFGSVARGDARADSDVDLMCDLDSAKPIGLFAFSGMQLRLQEVLDTKVDLVESAYIRPSIAARVRQDQVRIF